MQSSRRPVWLQKKISPAAHAGMDRLLEDLRLHTVCREASCPNISECYCAGRATFLILGAVCTRLCSFCNVRKETPLPPDPGEAERVAEAVVRLGLTHVVITSPTRDDLVDGGAGVFSRTVAAIRRASPATGIELLIPDFCGERTSLALVAGAGPQPLPGQKLHPPGAVRCLAGEGAEHGFRARGERSVRAEFVSCGKVWEK